MRDFIQALPKTETHLHIEGALPYELLTSWDPEQWPPDPAFRSRAYRYSTFPDFERILLDHALPWFTSAEKYHDAARAIFAKHVAQNVRYVETSFHLPITKFVNIPGREIIRAIRSAAPQGLEVRIFAGMLRSDLGGDLRSTIDELHTWDELSGVDLHGDEQLETHPDTADVWKKLRAEGKITKCHAGEFDGPARVREAIEVLGVNRIQHGVRAIEDLSVVKLAVERDVTFDMCPLSNVGLKVVPSMKDHPIRRLMAAGVRCTVSTDDPMCFANSLTDEYDALVSDLAFNRSDIAQVARSGWEIADVPVETRKAMIDEITRLVASAGG